MAKTTKKATKKAAAKTVLPNGAAELKAFNTALQNLKTAGSALAKVCRRNKELRQAGGRVRLAVSRVQDYAEKVNKDLSTFPPPTTHAG